MSEPDTIHTAAFFENELTCVECEDRITDPGGFAFDFERFVFGHRSKHIYGAGDFIFSACSCWIRSRRRSSDSASQ